VTLDQQRLAAAFSRLFERQLKLLEQQFSLEQPHGSPLRTASAIGALKTHTWH
jgi:hypothetical protein